VRLGQGGPSAALAVLEPWRRQVESKGWQDERLKVMILQAIALQAYGEKDKAVFMLLDALELAAPGGFIRLCVDEGPPTAHLLSEAEALGMMPDYTGKLLALLEAERHKREDTAALPLTQYPHKTTPKTTLSCLGVHSGMRLYSLQIEHVVQTEMSGHKRERVMPNEINSGSEKAQPLVYQIRIQGQLGREWTDWFGG